MNAEPQTPKRATGWSAIRQQISDWPKPALLALVKDLHDAAPENRDFLRARFDAENAGGEALEKYRRKIVEQFFPQRGFGKLKLAEARKTYLMQAEGAARRARGDSRPADTAPFSLRGTAWGLRQWRHGKPS